MEIEKLIKHMRKEAQDYRAGRTLGRAFADAEDILDEAATALEQLQAESDRLKAEVQQTRWIPVEERLPEEEGIYIVCVDGEVKSDAYCILEGIERWLCYNGNLNALYIDPYSSKPLRDGPYPRVTHWMSLPAAPKEEAYEK